MSDNASQKISVLVPVYDPHHQHFEFIAELLESLVAQTSMPREVVFSANHQVEYLSKLKKIVNDKFEVRWVLNSSKNAPENINEGVKACQSDIIKLLFQDDFLFDKHFLENLGALEPSFMWQLNGYVHVSPQGQALDHGKKPVLSGSLKQAINRVSAPSGAAFRRLAFQPVDSRFQYVFDCDWYLRMWHNLGEPKIDEKQKVAIRLHDKQATHWAKSFLPVELPVLRKNHRLRFLGGKCSCTKHISGNNSGHQQN